jgi:hypothetical protein
MRMFKKKTLFELGAGSSYEVNIPVGLGLAKTIGTKLDVRLGDYNKNVGEGDKYLLRQFQNQLPQQFNEYLAAGWRIRDGLPTASSIDDFLDMHSQDEMMQLIGKAAIVKSILEAEHESHIYFDQNNSRNKLVLGKMEGSKTYTEQIAGSEVTNRIRGEVERAEQVVFLGFAYHPQNMFLLRPIEELASSKPIYGTALGMSDSDVAITMGELRSWFMPDDVLSSDPFESIHIENTLTCAKLFDNYAKSIAGG